MSKKNKSNEWIIYPDIPDHIIIDEYKKQLNMQEDNKIVVDTITEEIENEISVEEKFESSFPEESKELTEEEKREIFIQKLKDSKKTYHPKKEFGVAYKAKRQKRNKQAKASRRANRK